MTLPRPFPIADCRHPLAAALLEYLPADIDRLLEPFAGSGALTIAASASDRASYFVLGDDNDALVAIWQLLIERPRVLGEGVAELVTAHGHDTTEVAAAYRSYKDPVRLLFLLNAPDQVDPAELSADLHRIHALLRGRAGTLAGDYSLLLRAAQPEDCVYLDPPSSDRDFDWERFEQCLADASAREVRFLVTTEHRLDLPSTQVDGVTLYRSPTLSSR